MKDDLPEINFAELLFFFFFVTFVSGQEDPFSELTRLADTLKDAKGTTRAGSQKFGATFP